MPPIRLLTLLSFAAQLATLTSCTDDVDDAQPTSKRVRGDISAIVQEAEAASEQPATSTQLAGLWRTKASVQSPNGTSAWVDLIWVFGDAEAWHAVSVFIDEDLTVPLARWDVVRAYNTGESVPISADAVALDWNDISSWIVAYTDVPALLGALGIDDCATQVDVPLDTSTNNCGEPFFPFRDCTLMDFAEVKDSRLTFGDPQDTDRCAERVGSYEEWSFERIPFTAEVREILAKRPPSD